MRRDAEAYRARTSPAPALLPVVKLDTGGEDPTGSAARSGGGEPHALRDLAEAARDLGAAGPVSISTSSRGEDLDALAPFFHRVQRTFRLSGLESCLVLPGDGEAWRNPDLTGTFDRIVLKLFRRAWVGSVPGPVADETWFEDTARQARDTIGADRLVVALGQFRRRLDRRHTAAGAAVLCRGRAPGRPGGREHPVQRGGRQRVHGLCRRRRARATGRGSSTPSPPTTSCAFSMISACRTWRSGRSAPKTPGLWPLLSSDIRNPSRYLGRAVGRARCDPCALHRRGCVPAGALEPRDGA